MSQIKVTDLTFSYDGSYDTIFEHTSFQIDTDWKLGFIGRNGRGKTTFLNLLQGKYEYQGRISASVAFAYFPYRIKDASQTTTICLSEAVGDFEEWRLAADLQKLQVEEEVLSRPFQTLSSGEQTKVLLAALFQKENAYLLIDEPTNHLDLAGRKLLADYLKGKKSFLLVSHDRAFLDQCIDHVLSINKNNIEVQKGNYSSWQQNKERQDQSEAEQNAQLKKDIRRLKQAAERTAVWSEQVESSKFAGGVFDKGFVGHKAAKAMKRSKSIEKRQDSAAAEKQNLLKNIEFAEPLKLFCQDFPKRELLSCKALSLYYGSRQLFSPVTFSVNRGDRILLKGKNGSGKSSLLQFLQGAEVRPGLLSEGSWQRASGLKISYVSQETSGLQGDLRKFAQEQGVDQTQFMTILRYLDFPRSQFEKDMAAYSMGQKKKVMLAKSLSEQAHFYIWDEPLNYVDVLSRIQIEEVLLQYQPSMIFVEHDEVFSSRVATRQVNLDSYI